MIVKNPRFASEQEMVDCFRPSRVYNGYYVEKDAMGKPFAIRYFVLK